MATQENTSTSTVTDDAGEQLREIADQLDILDIFSLDTSSIINQLEKLQAMVFCAGQVVAAVHTHDSDMAAFRQLAPTERYKLIRLARLRRSWRIGVPK